MIPVLRRDLAEQSWLLAPGCLVALTGLVLLASRGPLHVDGLLGAFDDFVLLCVVPLVLLTVRQLVVVEYVRRGIDLLETLPISWPAAVVGKLLAGAALVGGVLAAGAATTASALQLFRELPPGASEALVARGGAFTLAVYGGAFLLATFGRHRHAVLLGAVAAGGLLERAGALQRESLLAVGPARVARDGFMGPGVPFDRPTIESIVLGVACLALGLVLACVGRRRLVRAWSGPWTTADAGRALGLGLLALLVTVGPRAGQPPALRLEGEAARTTDVAVRVPGPDRAARAAEVAALTQGVLDELATRLELPPTPVGIEPGIGLPLATSERLQARAARGLLVRTPWTLAGWDEAAFRVFLASAALADAGPPGPDLALDGYPLWLVSRDDAALRARVELHAAWALETLGGLPRPEQWAEVHARVGPDAAASLGAWILAQLGDDAPHAAARAALRARTRPFARVLDGGDAGRLALASGGARADLEATLERAAAALQASRAAELAALPRPTLVQVDADAEGALQFTVTPGPGCVAGSPCALLHRPLSGAAGSEETALPRRRDEALVGGPPGRTEVRYPWDAAVRVAIAVPAPVPSGELVLSWRRLVVSRPRAAGP